MPTSEKTSPPLDPYSDQKNLFNFKLKLVPNRESPWLSGHVKVFRGWALENYLFPKMVVTSMNSRGRIILSSATCFCCNDLKYR